MKQMELDLEQAKAVEKELELEKIMLQKGEGAESLVHRFESFAGLLERRHPTSSRCPTGESPMARGRRRLSLPDQVPGQEAEAVWRESEARDGTQPGLPTYVSGRTPSRATDFAGDDQMQQGSVEPPPSRAAASPEAQAPAAPF